MYGRELNPPHIHVNEGERWFSITIKDRIVEGRGSSKTIKLINEYIDKNEERLLEIWNKAQKGEKIEKVKY